MSSSSSKKERSAWLKSHGICVHCGQRDAVPGITLCEICREKNRSQSERWRQKHPNYHKERYDKLKALSSCPECGKPNDTDYVLCVSCRQKRQLSYENELRGRGAGKPARTVKIVKPDGTCRRKGCWESALPFSCWCDQHKKEMNERRLLKQYLGQSASVKEGLMSGIV